MAYDPHNRCVTRTINGVSTSYIYEDWNLIQEYASTAETEARRYIHGARIDELIAMIDSSGTSYYHHDALGSTVALSDEDGLLLESVRYDAYGRPQFFDASGQIATSLLAGNRFLFTGREWLSGPNFQENRHRYYMPEAGRWLTRDPLPNVELSETPNLYSYVRNLPTNRTDPDGRRGIGEMVEGLTGWVTNLLGAVFQGLGHDDAATIVSPPQITDPTDWLDIIPKCGYGAACVKFAQDHKQCMSDHVFDGNFTPCEEIDKARQVVCEAASQM